MVFPLHGTSDAFQIWFKEFDDTDNENLSVGSKCPVVFEATDTGLISVGGRGASCLTDPSRDAVAFGGFLTRLCCFLVCTGARWCPVVLIHH